MSSEFTTAKRWITKIQEQSGTITSNSPSTANMSCGAINQLVTSGGR